LEALVFWLITSKTRGLGYSPVILVNFGYLGINLPLTRTISGGIGTPWIIEPELELLIGSSGSWLLFSNKGSGALLRLEVPLI
jgi:hypothetical protein